MTGTPQRTPTFASRHAIRLAARVLPAGSARQRYRLEFLAELHGMTRNGQRRHALSVLLHSWALRGAVGGAPQPHVSEVAMTTSTRKSPLACRLNIRHKWQPQRNPEGEKYFRCARCGKDRYDPEASNGPNIGPQLGVGSGGGT